jgi:hypothetical protein
MFLKKNQKMAQLSRHKTQYILGKPVQNESKATGPLRYMWLIGFENRIELGKGE